jgi:hypothetical protein
MDKATFEIGRDPPKDDGLRQIEPDEALLEWVRSLFAPAPKPEPQE